MTEEKDENGQLLPEEQRLTKLGKFIRRSSLDELPQFINILFGQMSLIGPRPFLVEYYNYYLPVELERHSVRPGITSLAAVYGRVSLEWNKRLDYDIYYIKNQGIILDIEIIFLTIKTVINSFLNPIYDPVKVLPLFNEDRAYIRMINNNDDESKIWNLLSKGRENFFLDKKKLILSSFKRENFNKKQLLLIDDYRGTYNSFMLFEIKNNNKLYIIDYYFTTNTFLQEDQMIKKYTNIAQRHFKLIGNKDLEVKKRIIK